MKYDISKNKIKLHESLSLDVIGDLKGIMDEEFPKKSKKWVVDLKEVNSIDTAAIQFFVILKKNLENQGLNKKSIQNFRNDIESKSAILKDQNVAISKKNSKFTNMINATLLACLYHKYSEIINLNTLRAVSDSYAGNNSCVIYRGQRLNHRILRYSYYISQLKNKLDFKQD